MTALFGFLFGFVGSVPVAGPIAALVFSRSVQARYRSAIGIAAGGALAEAGYAFMAFWGLSHLLDAFPLVARLANGLAALLLAALGIAFIRSRSGADAASSHHAAERVRDGFWVGFGITALNPTLIGTWSAATATLISTQLIAADPSAAIPFSLSAAAGIFSWFAVLVALVHHFRRRMTTAAMDAFVRVMGVFLLGCAAYFAYAAVA